MSSLSRSRREIPGHHRSLLRAVVATSRERHGSDQTRFHGTKVLGGNGLIVGRDRIRDVDADRVLPSADVVRQVKGEGAC